MQQVNLFKGSVMIKHSPVLTYKVKRAIEAGAEKNPSTLAVLLDRPTDVRAIDRLLMDIDPAYYEEHLGQYLREKPPITIEALIQMAKEMDRKEFEEFEVFSHPCACMGSQGEWKECPCMLRYELFRNKADILKYLLLEENGV